MPAMLDPDQLKTFVAIAENGSFTRAAELVFKTQSAVSMQMKRLEEAVGVPLFERDGRNSRLTPEGYRLLEYARRIVKLNQEAVSAFSAAELSGRVRLGVPDDYADRYLPEILAGFSRSNPRAEVSVTCEPTSILREAVKNDLLDLAIITQSDEQGPSEVFRQESLLWVTAMRGDVHQADPLPLAVGHPTCCWRQIALDTLERQGRRSRILYSSSNASAVVAAVLAGLAVSVLAESSLRPGIRVLTPKEGFPVLPVVRIGLIRNWSHRSPLSDALADHIVGALENLSSEAA